MVWSYPLHKLFKRATIAVRVLRESGPKALWHRIRNFTGKRVYGWNRVIMLVHNDDAINADWTDAKSMPKAKRAGMGPYTFNWILCPPSGGSGGHTTMFRFVRYLEARGHTVRLYYYSTNGTQSVEELRTILKTHFIPMKAELLPWTGEMLPADAIVATGWETAYPAFNSITDAHKFYFVQDYEPFFYPIGSESVLAENTYNFGFTGITAGRWLTEKLSKDFGMACDYFDFGSDATQYVYRNAGERKAVMFYARPVTPRRGFELGVLALTLFHRMHPDYTIHLVGWNVGDYKLDIPVVNHGIVTPTKLDEIYNECAAGLVISLTNMSLLPLELLSSGCIPVVNDAPNNRLVSNNDHIKYAVPTPHALAQAMSEVVRRRDLPAYAKTASKSVGSLSWDDAGNKVVKLFEGALRG